VSRAGVECRNVLEALAAGLHEQSAVLDGDLFESLQAVDGEPWTYHGDCVHTARGHGGERGLRIGPEPLRGSKARLEAHAPLTFLQQQLISE